MASETVSKNCKDEKALCKKNGDGKWSKDTVSERSLPSSDTLPTPPDGGYGWVIVIAAFFCNMITDGTAFSFGVLYEELLDYFHDSKSKTSMVGSIFMGVPLLASPIASALINKFGCRSVSIAGGVLSTFGFVLSYFATSIEFLCLSFGLISGLGLSMVYTPAVVVVAFYFEKRRALATGLSVAGSGLGTLMFAPLVENLTVNYGWRGAILILAGIMLNTCLFGALYRPLTHPVSDDKYEEEEQKPEEAVTFDNDACSSQIAKIRELYSDPYSHSLIQFPTYLSEEMSARSSAETLAKSVSISASNEDCRFSKDIVKDVSPAGSERRLETQLSLPNGDLTSKKHRSQTAANDRKSSATHPLYRRDIFYKGSLLWIPQARHPQRVSSCPDLYIRHNSSDDDDDDDCCEQFECCQWKHVKRVVKEMLDITIFKKPLYLLFFISNFLLYMWYDIPYFYLPDSASTLGLSNDQASLIISVIGIGNTIGQVAFGVIADLPMFNNAFVYGFGIFMCGISILFIPLCVNMVSLCAAGSLFGLFIGANYALCSIIIVDLLSLEKLTNAYGIVLCGQGVANLIGPPIGGLISDYTNSYQVAYLCSGAFIALSGMIMLAVALHECMRKKPGKLVILPDSEVLSRLTAV